MAWNTHPQAARGYVYLLQPDVVFQARVNMAAATYPTAEITYDTVTTGSYNGINIGQTILIGSTAGAWDLGRTYLRAAPDADTLPIGWSSRGRGPGEVTLTDNAYITVLDLYEVWEKPGRTDSGTGEIWKDYDLDGTTPPTPIMCVGDAGGVGRIDFTDGSVLSIQFDYTGSQLIGDGETWDQRTWTFFDGSIVSGTDTSADPVVEFPAGKRWIWLYGNSSEGAIMYRRYLVVALDPTNPDVIRANNIRLRRTADGQTLTCDLQEYVDPANYPPGTVCLLLMREKRGDVVEYVQRFAGWLDSENSFANAGARFTNTGTTINAVDVAGKLAQLRALPSTVANEATQSTWLEMVDANPDRYIHRHLAFETTALAVADLSLSGLTGSPSYPFMDYWTSGGSYWDVCDGLAQSMAYKLTCDSLGHMYVLPDPMRQNSGDRTATEQQNIGESDWSAIQWQTRARSAVAAVNFQGVVISSGYASSLPTPFPDEFAVAPGLVPGQGISEQSAGVGIVQDETEAQERAGHDYARASALDSYYTIDLAHGVDADIEPAFMTWITLTATQAKAGYRGPTLTDERMLPISVDISVDSVTGVSTQRIVAERETVGEIGDERP